jgi:hypothetical protein
MPTQSQPETPEAETPAAVAAVADGTEDTDKVTPAVESGEQQQEGAQDAPAEGDKGEGEAEKTPEQQAEEKAAAEKAEGELKASAEKYAKELVSQANRTMAAARRAERAVAETKTQNAALTKENEVLTGFVDQLKREPMRALGRLGFSTFKEFAQHVLDTGGERELTEDERIESAVSKALEKANAPRAKADQEAAVAESRKAVFAFVDENKAKYVRTATGTGKATLWATIVAYHDKHGAVDDDAVAYLADQVEKDLRAEFGEPTVTPGPGGKQGTKSAAAPAATAARNGGTSLAGKPMSGAPAAKKYSDDPDERTAQINAELKAEGIL